MNLPHWSALLLKPGCICSPKWLLFCIFVFYRKWYAIFIRVKETQQQTIWPGAKVRLKAGVYDLGDLKVASPPNSSLSPLSSLLLHLEPPTDTPPAVEEQAGGPQTAREFWEGSDTNWEQIISQTKFSDVGLTGMTNCKVITMHVETNVAFIAHYSVHSCPANVSVLARNAISVMSQLCIATYKQLALLLG